MMFLVTMQQATHSPDFSKAKFKRSLHHSLKVVHTPATGIAKGSNHSSSSPWQYHVHQQHKQHANPNRGTAAIEVFSTAGAARPPSILAEDDSIAGDQGQEHHICVCSAKQQ